MADIFAGTEPPAWLQRMTAQEPGMLGSIFGELVGGLADAGETAIDRATAKQKKGIDTNWIKELPGSIKPGLAEARLNTQNPLWKIQLQQSQLNMAEQGLRIKNEQSLIQTRQQRLRMQEHDQEILPQWLREHPTWESRQNAEPPVLYTPEAIRMWRDVQLSDAGNVKEKASQAAVASYSKNVDKLSAIDAEAASPYAAQIGRVITPQMQSELATALGKAEQKKRAEDMRVTTARDEQGNVVGVIVGKTFHSKTASQEEAPKGAITQRDEEGNVIGWTVGKKFIEKKAPKPGAPPKPSADVSSELTYGRERLLAIDKAMADPANVATKKQDELKKQRADAQAYYDNVLRKAGGQPAPAPITGQQVSAAYTAPAAPTEKVYTPADVPVPDQRVAGKTMARTPRGLFRWNGKGWDKIGD